MTLVWLGLLLAPLFKEVSLFGFKFKHDLVELKNEMRADMLSLRADIQQVSVQNSFSPQIAVGSLAAPAPDATLKALEERLPIAIADALRASGLTTPPLVSPAQARPDEQYLYGVRVELEREMRRIVRQRQLSPLGPRVLRPTDLPTILVRSEFISPEIGSAIREAYLICSQALHAADVTPTQIAFVKDVAPRLLGALKAIN